MLTPATYFLDVAYSSATPAADGNNPIAMMFGFAVLDAGILPVKALGQTEDIVEPNIQFVFDVFDFAPTPLTVSKIEITFKAKSGSSSTSPFNDASGHPINPIVINNPTISGSDGPSYGCNVVGTSWWRVGPYITANLGDYGVTIKVTLVNDAIFKVDPRIIVSQGNK